MMDLCGNFILIELKYTQSRLTLDQLPSQENGSRQSADLEC